MSTIVQPRRGGYFMIVFSTEVVASRTPRPRLTRRRALLVALCAAVAQSCGGSGEATTESSGIPSTGLPVAASITVSPPSGTVLRGAATQFSATVMDKTGATISGVAVSWTSSDQTVMSITSSGSGTALKAGTATISASAGGVVGTVTMTVTEPAPPALHLSASAVSFAAAAVGPLPSGQDIAISNSGSGTITGIQAALVPTTGPTGPIGVAVAAATAPTTVSIRPTTTTVAPGTYKSQVQVTGTGVSPVTIDVTLTVSCGTNTTVVVSPGSARLKIAATTTLAAAITNCPDVALTWTSANPGVATVTSAGVVTGVGAGTTTVSATHATGASAAAAITVDLNTFPPTISIVSIQSGGQQANALALKGQVDVVVNVDGGGNPLSRIDLLLGSTVVISVHVGSTASESRTTHSTTATPAVLSFDSKLVANGTYAMQAVVTAQDGTTGKSTPISVTISNP